MVFFLFVDLFLVRMAGSLVLPAPEEVATKNLATDLYALFAYAGLTEDFALGVAKALGCPDTKEGLSKVSPAMLAMAEEADFVTAIAGVADTFFKKNVALMAYKLAVGLTTAPASTAPSGPTSSGSPGGTTPSSDDKVLGLRKHKVSNLTDPMDE